MSTNYYWNLNLPAEVKLPSGVILPIAKVVDDDDPRIHIGKSTAKTFTWAQSPVCIQAVGVLDSKVIISQLGDRLTGRELLAIVREREENFDSIGRRFS